MTANLRAEFEAWAESEGMYLLHSGDSYQDEGTHGAWLAYQHARSLSAAEAKDIQDRLLSDKCLEIGRKAIEDVLIEFRDSRIGQLRNNGLVIKEYDGTDSHIIRLGPEDALRIGIKAMLASDSAGGSKG